MNFKVVFLLERLFLLGIGLQVVVALLPFLGSGFFRFFLGQDEKIESFKKYTHGLKGSMMKDCLNNALKRWNLCFSIVKLWGLISCNLEVFM